MQDKAQHLQNFTCCFWYAVLGFILDSKSREPRKEEKKKNTFHYVTVKQQNYIPLHTHTFPFLKD